MLKRLFDIVFAGCGLVILSPVFLVSALLVKLADGGPVLFRQQRVGQGGRMFWILKFRSMVINAERLGLSVTKDGDPRITRIGRFLRKSKLDELPQLWNVWRGDMSLVGPRPEVPRYVAKYSPAQKRVLALKPGITDPATLEFRNEEELLLVAEDTESFYLDYCIPRKIELNLAYAERASLWEDARIILRTLMCLRRQASGRSPGQSAAMQPFTAFFGAVPAGRWNPALCRGRETACLLTHTDSSDQGSPASQRPLCSRLVPAVPPPAPPRFKGKSRTPRINL